MKNEVNSGPGFSRQQVLNRGTGEWIIFVDDDDIFIDDVSEYLYTENADVVITNVYNQGQACFVDVKNTLRALAGSAISRQYINRIGLAFPPELKFAGEDTFLTLLMHLTADIKAYENYSFIQRMDRTGTKNDITNFTVPNNIELYQKIGLEVNGYMLTIGNIDLVLLKYAKYLDKIKLLKFFSQICDAAQHYIEEVKSTYYDEPKILTIINYYCFYFSLKVFYIFHKYFSTIEIQAFISEKTNISTFFLILFNQFLHNCIFDDNEMLEYTHNKIYPNQIWYSIELNQSSYYKHYYPYKSYFSYFTNELYYENVKINRQYRELAEKYQITIGQS